MKKKLIIGLTIMISIIMIAIIAVIPIERNDKTGAKWMGEVEDSRLITDLSIPGTHDSGATHSIFDVAGKCQDTSISRQLNMGVRFFDLRLQLVNNEFRIVHSFVDQDLKFKDVMKDISEFISRNKSEFIIISIKQEETSKDSTLDFKDELIKILNEFYVCLDNCLPNTLGEARGKIYVLSRYNLEFGIPAYSGWVDDDTFELNGLYIQDNYCIEDIEEKKKDIVDTINYSNNNDCLVLNFTSCYLDNAFPPTYAGTTARIINPWFIKYISSCDAKLGIIVADFMSADLAKSIYRRNII